MKIKVDFDLCESNALCDAMAPEVFYLDDGRLPPVPHRPDHRREQSTTSSVPWPPVRAPPSP